MTITLVDLRGMKKKKIEAEYIRKPSEIKSILDKGLAVTASNNNGAFNIWKDDEGKIRCESMRYLSRLEHKEYKNISDVKKWASKWLKKIQ